MKSYSNDSSNKNKYWVWVTSVSCIKAYIHDCAKKITVSKESTGIFLFIFIVLTIILDFKLKWGTLSNSASILCLSHYAHLPP